MRKLTAFLFIILSFICLGVFKSSPAMAANRSKVSGRAEILNTGDHLHFTDYNANVYVDNASGDFSGYGWLVDVGWCDFGQVDNPNGPVNVDFTTGTVSGRAYCLNGGHYINFTNNNANVLLGDDRSFAGYAWSEDLGWLNFGSPGVSMGAKITLSQLRPRDYINHTRPSLVFKKGENATDGINNYDVYLDHGKSISYSISGIPSEGNGNASYIWKDNDEVKVIFENEENSDSSDDEIAVYFKGLDGKELSEGEHSWRVNVESNNKDEADFATPIYVDLTVPEIKNISLDDLQMSIMSGGEYSLDNTMRQPQFSLRARDVYSNGVSSGPNKLKVKFYNKKIENYFKACMPYLEEEYELEDIKDNIEVEKYKMFSFKSSSALKDGYYTVVLELEDKAGNKEIFKPFYVLVNYSGSNNAVGGAESGNMNNESGIMNKVLGKNKNKELSDPGSKELLQKTVKETEEESVPEGKALGEKTKKATRNPLTFIILGLVFTSVPFMILLLKKFK